MLAAIGWCYEHMEGSDTFTVWTSLKSNLQNCSQLEDLVSGRSEVEHLVGRGGGSTRGHGPVLMAWPDMADIGLLVQHGGHRIRALGIIAGDQDEIRPWVTAMSPSVLGDGSAWDELTPDLDLVVVEALKSLTQTLNHNNTISAGYEKDQVVRCLLALHDAGLPMDGTAMEGWALAHGWSGRNPERLARYVEVINAGRRPRHHGSLGPEYIATIRRRAADNT
ncbi:hypothetical protein ACH4TU_33000 [Streptomyces physcomitrii]